MGDFAYANLLRSLNRTICKPDKSHAGLLHFLGDRCVTFQRITIIPDEKTVGSDLYVILCC